MAQNKFNSQICTTGRNIKTKKEKEMKCPKHRCSECEHWKAGDSWRMVRGTVYAPGTCTNTGLPRMNVRYCCKEFKEAPSRGKFIKIRYFK